jgi:hypothetical protein
MWYNWYQDHPEEWVRRLELQYRDLQLFESRQADEVQRCTTIDKDMVQLDVDDGWGDEQRELPGPCHALGSVRGVEVDQRLHPLAVWHRLWGRCGGCHLSTQVFDDAVGCDVPRNPEHDVERLVSLVVTGLRV